MDVVYFTGGTVGAGHLARGVAIGRALGRLGFGGRYRMLGPPLAFPVAAAVGYEAVAIDQAALIDPACACATALGARLVELAPDVLVVDMFWALVQHVLPSLAAEAWLLVRAAPPEWLIGPPQIRFDESAWDRVVGIEPIAPSGVREHLAPIVIANRDELEPVAALRERLGIAAGERVDVVVHAGKLDEITALTALSPHARLLDLRARDAPFPAALWLPGADRITCGAGYNAFWEARWLGFHQRARFVPFERRIDDQARRLRECSDGPLVENGADVVAGWLARRAP